MPELLLEILSEEIPARMQGRAAEDLKRLVTQGLKEAGLTFSDAQAFSTPRRLALVVTGLPEESAPGKIEQKGPSVRAPKEAIEGFLRKVARRSVDDQDIVVKETDKGSFYFFEALTAPKQTIRELSSIIGDAMEALPWPKSMRWGTGRMRWIRPIHRILCLFGGSPVALPSDWEASVMVDAETIGHRFLAPHPFKVAGFADYRKKLAAAKVMLDAGERRSAIRDGAARLARAAGLDVKEDEGLLDEVAGLVEWPVVLMGDIDRSFMDLPAEVLTTAMRTHQRYFALLDDKGRLAPRFIVVANTETEDGGRAVVAGNERVLRARLSDARYFWDHDRKKRLGDRVDDLGQLVFHAKLGSMADKAERLQTLATGIARIMPRADGQAAGRAAYLAKADLATDMVGEFPELQGVMGRYYALNDGEAREVADAIGEHYAPQGPHDRCPTAPVSVAVALADKIDTLVGFFAISEKPTGSRDPFALRRAALGVVRLIVENELRVPLLTVFDAAAERFRSFEAKPSSLEQLLNKYIAEHHAISSELLDFFIDRLKVHLREQGVRHDLIAAVFALGGEDDLVRLLARVEALGAFLESEDGANLLTAFRRAANIVRIEEKKDGVHYGGEYDATLTHAPEERTLAASLKETVTAADAALGAEDFRGAMAALARLRRPVDDFFDRVTVNVDDAKLRANRLRLLSGIGATMNQVADFSQIEGGER